MRRIYKRGNVWYIDYFLGGKRVRKRISQSKHLADIAIQDVQVRKEKGELGFISTSIKLNELINHYLEYSKINKSSNVFYNEIIYLKKHLLSFIGFLNCSKITPEMIERYKAHRLQKIQPATLNREFNTIRNMFNKAEEWKYLLKSPMQNVKQIKSQKKVSRFLSKEEIKKLLSNCQGQERDIILTFLNTGLRRSELINLKWEDIDFESHRIIIRKTKSYKPRFIPINKQLLKVLGKRKKKAGYIFATKEGKPIQNNLLRRIKGIYKKAGIKNANSHSLRHSLASHLVMAGVDLATVRELLGPSDIKTTMIYAHLAPEHLRQATERLRF